MEILKTTSKRIISHGFTCVVSWDCRANCLTHFNSDVSRSYVATCESKQNPSGIIPILIVCFDAKSNGKGKIIGGGKKKK